MKYSKALLFGGGVGVISSAAGYHFNEVSLIVATAVFSVIVFIYLLVKP